MQNYRRLVSTAVIATSILAVLPGYSEEKKAAPKSTSAQNNAELPNKAPDAQDQEPKIDMKQLSEALGHFIGKNLHSPGIDFDLDSIIKGIRNGSEGKPSPMNEQEYEVALSAVQERAWRATSEANLKAANEFLAKNKPAPNIIEVEPGKLQYEILQPGKGEVVAEHSTPMIHFTGKFLNGEVFGTSQTTGEPITLPLDQTMPGFSKGLLGMKEGEKRRLFIHPDLGYGVFGHLPPNSLLIFDIELVKANAVNEKDNSLNDEIDLDGDQGFQDLEINTNSDSDLTLDSDMNSKKNSDTKLKIDRTKSSTTNNMNSQQNSGREKPLENIKK